MDPAQRFDLVEQEILDLGSPRGLSSKLHRTWRRRGAVVLSVAVGVAAGALAALTWKDRYDDRPSESQPSALAAGQPPVRLVLGGVSGAPRDRYLSIEAVLLHDRGAGTATVRRIHRPGTSLSIRVPDLPVTLSANHPYERVHVRIAPRDCVLATQWTPSAQPLTLSWEDERGTLRSGIGGDHDASVELSLIRHMSAVCDDPAEQ
jgi:hypothetical protein